MGPCLLFSRFRDCPLAEEHRTHLGQTAAKGRGQLVGSPYFESIHSIILSCNLASSFLLTSTILLLPSHFQIMTTLEASGSNVFLSLHVLDLPDTVSHNFSRLPPQ